MSGNFGNIIGKLMFNFKFKMQDRSYREYGPSYVKVYPKKKKSLEINLY